MSLKSVKSSPLIAMGIVLIMHIVGIIGLNSAYSQQFVALTPLNLLIAFLIILPFTDSTRNNFVIFLMTAFVIGMTVEVFGVFSGVPFGEYYYTSILGPAIWGVPILIGINWFVLAYGIISLIQNIITNLHLVLKSIVAACLMTAMDVLIEPFAIKHQLWVWIEHEVPIQNYLAWFIISFIIFLVGFKLIPKEKNKVAAFTIVVFFLFFGLNLLLN